MNTENKGVVGVMLIVVILMVFSLSAKASEKYNCEEVYYLAETVMTARQEGMPYPEIAKSTDNSRLSKLIAEQAYDTDRKITDKWKKRVVVEFANSWYSDCRKHQ